MVVNMEALIEYRMLGALSYDLLKRVSSAARVEQFNKTPVTRSSLFVDRAMEKYGDWLGLQDIPQSFVRIQPTKDRIDVARQRSIPDGSAPTPISKSISEDIFAMDGVSSSPPITLESSVEKTPSKRSSGWKPIGPVIKCASPHRLVAGNG